MSDFMEIGQYQLENLMKNGVRFSYFDLSDTNATAQHPLLKGSQQIGHDAVVKHIGDLGLSKDAPIVLICQNGTKSLEVARKLSENSYLNVYVIEGGHASLT
ncbi:MAG: rhodanese-like domain-containing protein [Bdellovibrionota bacterium]